MAYKPTLFGENSVIGKSMAVYAQSDDYGRGNTESSEASGSLETPIACCHIKMVQIVRPTAGTTEARTSNTTTTRTRGGDVEKAEDLGGARRLSEIQQETGDADAVSMTPEEFAEVFGFLPDVDGDDGDLFFG